MSVYRDIKTSVPKTELLLAKFAGGTYPVSAVCTWDITAAGDDIAFTADGVGASYNTKTIAATANGSAAATCTITFGADTITASRAAGGTAGNGWQIILVPGGTHASETVTLDTPNKIAYVSYEASASHTTDIAAAIDAATGWDCATTGTETDTGTIASTVSAGGTPQDWVAWAAGTLAIHFTATVSTGASVITAVNTGITSAGGTSILNKWCTAAATGVVGDPTLDVGDAFVATAMTSFTSHTHGVTEVLPAIDSNFFGCSVSHTSAGVYVLTLPRLYKAMVSFPDAGIEAPSASLLKIKPYTYSLTSKTATYRCVDESSGNAANLTASNKCHVAIILKR